MAFNPSGTNYAAMLSQRAQADRGLTEAKRRRGERDREARVKASGKRSGLQKLVSAGVRGAAAYYTGGMSEQMGMGGAIDSVMLGTDSEGRAVRNEYGDLVGAGSAVYQGMSAQKDAKLAKQDAKYNALRDRRMKTVEMLFDANMPDRAMAMQSEVEDMDYNYQSKRKGVEDQGLFSRPDYSSIQPDQMSPEERKATSEAKRREATGESTADASQAFTGDQTRGGTYTGEQTPMKTKTVNPWSPMAQAQAPQIGIAELDERALADKKKLMEEKEKEKAEEENRLRRGGNDGIY